MLISIYKKNDDGFEQKFIEETESVPDGWTTELKEVYVEEDLTELEELKQNQTIMMEALMDIAENQSIQDEGLTEIAEIVSGLVGGDK